MNRQTVLDIVSGHRAEMARRFGVKSLALFGSMARDEAGSASDVEFWLEELLGRPVDLVMKGALKPWARSVVEAEAIIVA